MNLSSFFRTSFIAGSIFFGVAVFSEQALAWGSAAHAYMTSKAVHEDKGNAVYGSTAPDMFQYAFDNSCLSVIMHDNTHHKFMQVWTSTMGKHDTTLKAAVFGFVAHNDTWGEDATAHHDGFTAWKGKGYVTAKAEQLKTMLQQVSEFQALGIPDEAALTISHELVEDSIDILVTRVDKRVGQKIFIAAKGRARKFPLLLADTYAADLASCAGLSKVQAKAEIINTESRWRGDMMAYGVMLSQNEATQVRLMTEQVVAIASGFLASNGITPPPGADLRPLVQLALITGIDLCKDDFKAELDATARAVAIGLASNGVSY